VEKLEPPWTAAPADTRLTQINNVRTLTFTPTDDAKLLQKRRQPIQDLADSLSDVIADPRTTEQDKTTAAKQRDGLLRLDTKIEDATTACNTDGYRITVFAGLSGTLLHTEAAHDDVARTNTEDPLFKEMRFTFGAEVQSSFTGAGSTLLPRIGFYTTLSHGTWKDRFAAPGLNQDIHPFQVEGGLYVSGHVIGGFDVLLSFVALKSYGAGQTSYLINVAPAIGALLGGK
jgi:hypothetical protein